MAARGPRYAIALAVTPAQSKTGQPKSGAAHTADTVSGPSHSPPSGRSAPRKPAEISDVTRITALVDLARGGDAEAFGQLYDHYVSGIFRFIYYRVGSRQIAEDLTSDTFTRALRAVQRFTWQGRDFGAWLTTIARNLVADHHKSGRSRLEFATDQLPESHVVGTTESAVMSQISNDMLFEAVNALSAEQRDCVLMRFIQELSVAQTAAALGRSEGAIKQLQFRAVRNLANIIDQDAL